MIVNFIKDCKEGYKNNNNNNVIIIIKDFYEYNIELIVIDIKLLKSFVIIIIIISLLGAYYGDISLINIKKNCINSLKFS